MKEEYSVTISCASGIERALKSELNRLGYIESPFYNGATNVTTDLEGILRLNTCLRTADRVYVSLKKFDVFSFDDLFDNVVSIDFSEFIGKDAEIYVDGKCVKSTIFAISACQRVVKKAICQSLMKSYKVNSLSESKERVEVDFYIYKDNCEIRLNTSGKGLNKRGYRDLVGIAPIKETLASAMLLYSDYYYKKPFLDPFCGSGTLAIECALIATNTPPNLKRDFDIFNFKIFDKKVFERVKEEGYDKIKRNESIEIYASDIDKKAIKLATHHAENAGVLDCIKFGVKDVKDAFIPLKNGTIVTNPPYGERVYDFNDAKECYKSLGCLYSELDNFSMYVITNFKNFEKELGFKADRKRKLYNSEKECNFYYFYKKEIK